MAERREHQAQKAKDVLQAMLGPLGIIVEKVLTKDYRFNAEYQKAIEDKKIADQRVERHKSAQRATAEEYKRKLEDARGEVNKLVADADGEYQKAKIEADAHYEKQELLAEAIKAEGIAEAKGIQEMNHAMETHLSAGSQAPVWEPSREAPASRVTGMAGKDLKQSFMGIGSQAGAWEPAEQIN